MNSDRRVSWFKLSSIEACEIAIWRFALVAISTAVCAIVALIVIFAQVESPDWIVLPSVLAHVAIVSALANLLLRKSRAASVALLVYLVSSSIVLWWLGHPDGWFFRATAVLVPAVFLLFGSLAVVATFRWHERYRSASLAGGVARAA